MKTKLTLTFALIGLLVLPAMAKDTSNLLKNYDAVSTALANDNLDAAKSSASTLAEQAKTDGNAPFAEHAAELAKSDTLEAAREHFKAMSPAAIALAKGSDEYHVMNCPMAKASWVQSGEKVMNPYMGKEMQQCGSMVTDKDGASTGSGRSMSCCGAKG